MSPVVEAQIVEIRKGRLGRRDYLSESRFSPGPTPCGRRWSIRCGSIACLPGTRSTRELPIALISGDFSATIGKQLLRLT